MKKTKTEIKGKPRGRKGGRHPIDLNLRRHNTYLDPATVQTLTNLSSNAKLSDGIRIAGRIINSLDKKTLESLRQKGVFNEHN